MQLDKPFNHIPVVPDKALLDYDYSNIDWSVDTVRQKSHPNHQETLTFPFIKSEFNETASIIRYNQTHELYKPAMKEVVKLERYFDARVRTAVLAGVIPFGKIPTHKDESRLFHIAHRCHLPLVTNSNAIFTIEDIEYNFTKGNWIEIDNRRFHSVHNNSNIIRVHFLVDLIPNETNRLY